MAKSKPQDPEPKCSVSKKKKLHSNEQDVSMDVNVERKVKKKKKAKTDTEVPIIALSKPVSEEAPTTNLKKRKQPTEHIRKVKKKKKAKISETTKPLKQEEEEEDEEVMEGEEDLSPEERRVLDRKMKKILKKDKKNKLKMEGKTEEMVDAHKPIAPQQALDYLSCWAENRKEWKFQKTRQTWLLQHMFDTEKVPDESFSLLLQYLEGLRGVAKDTTVLKAEALTREHEGSEEEEALKKTDRAREIIQLLS
ncbi:uncharacterized protein C7orf50 homolog [Hypomesus transpacificus]|uniref:uncharacterized protein C7orf50 homolog n=1 Tax=Hypomesus transpacificus TaxID=137520 RepID=UPI001F078268|nr:uncharacterized protein C7orf50 homolog [Hypomesus transpacificus]